MVLSELVEFGPCFSVETVKACALIGLHMMAEENALRSDRDSAHDLGEMWKYGCPKSPVWSGDGFEGEGSVVFGVPKKFSGGSDAAAKIFSHRGRAVTTEGEGCGERNEGEGT